MRNLTLLLAGLFCLFVSKLIGQESFESQAKAIAISIETITKEEKNALKQEIEAVNLQLQEGKITSEQAETKMKILAETRAKTIETRVAKEQTKLNDLVQNQVDGKITKNDSIKTIIIRWNDDFDFINKKKKSHFGEKRTTSQFVFAMGLNNVLIDGSLQDNDFKFIGSHFYEWGGTYNTRLFKEHNLLHLKYGLSVQYNNLRPTNDRSFVVVGNQTILEKHPYNLKESRLRNVNLVLPMHLEFDFSGSSYEDEKTYFRTHQAFRLGIGGYAGINLKTKQKLQYQIEDTKVSEKTKADFNTSNFIYGLSAYLGYKTTSLYFKYDLNPLFERNSKDQHTISMGIRFDLN